MQLAFLLLALAGSAWATPTISDPEITVSHTTFTPSAFLATSVTKADATQVPSGDDHCASFEGPLQEMCQMMQQMMGQMGSQTSIPALDFEGFTHMPVDFHSVLRTTSSCVDAPRLFPFFNYLNTNHAEGPKKWYIYTCPWEVVKVYLPAKAILHHYSIRAYNSEEGKEGHYNGEKVLINVQAWFNVSPSIQVFYMHLTLRDEINKMVQNSQDGYVVLDAGTHIGYIYNPPHPHYSLDFGVEDLDKDSGQTQDPRFWLNIRVNPLDYFTQEVRQSILEAYQPVVDYMVAKGTFAYSDLEDSRQNINEQDTLWGVWFKDDLKSAWGGSAWSVVNIVKKVYLHPKTYWRTLQQFPTMSGLFVEQARGGVVGKPLYQGQPMGYNKIFILSGNELAGVARIEQDWSGYPRVYLKYEVQPNTESKFDDKLIMESFYTQEAAESSRFSDKAVTFRREP